MAYQTRGEYERSRVIRAAPEAVFEFVADVHNLPKFMPTTKRVEPQPGGRVRVEGEAEGHAYAADGYLRADRDRLRLEWGADERHYAGHLSVAPESKDRSEVTVHLSFLGPPPGTPPKEGPSESEIRDGLDKALQSIENYVTGQGVKVEPKAAT